MNNEKELTVKEAFDLAIQNHQNNNLQDAQNYYQKVLKIDSNYTPALNNLGVIYKNLQENQKARDCYEKAIEINPNYANAHLNLGVLFKELGNDQKAKGSFEKAISIDPRDVKAHNNLGNIFKDLGEYQKAKDCYEKAIKIYPNYTDALDNLGVIFQGLGENQKAIECYKKVIKIDPNYVKALNNLGVILQRLGENQEAKECYEKAIAIDPNYVKALNNLGVILQRLGVNQEAKECYEKAITINPNYTDARTNLSSLYIGTLDDLEKSINSSYNTLKIFHNNSKFTNQSVPLFRLKHDVQQAQYLISKNYKIEGINEFKKISGEILNRVENNYNKRILLTPSEIDALLPFYKSDHVYKPKTISGSCINPNKKWQEVEDEYFNSSNQIIYIDDFLSEEALIELREFCLVSKVWNKDYSNNYLGAFSDSGFISPVHLQIAIELKQKLPKLFGPHSLGKFWGFKYDSTLGKGINIHADFAIHNLNFWITPDEYNNNKNSGGLKVYDAPAPDNWTFENYNMDSDKIYEFLKENNANCTNVPYRFNRAVLFNSAYFHETDEIDFKDEYVGRRINNTYLFGSRLIKPSLD
jgi:tetratricopeptide (TPR) repeat protein